MITVSFEGKGKCGLCEWIYLSIKNQISGGTLKPNEKLPSKRTLAENLGVSVITVQNAYSLLISEGYIYSIEKKGFFVTELRPVKHKNISSVKTKENLVEKKEWLADFSSNSTGYEKFPFALWSHTMRQILNSKDEKLLQRVGIKGVAPLRIALVKHLLEFRSMNVKPEQIVIGAGTENLYSMVVQLLGQDNIFAVENPGYRRAAKVFELNGTKALPIKIDEHGMNPDELEKSGANVAHVCPNHHFPTGIIMPIRRRQEILAWANNGNNRYILEDDYDSEFRFIGKPLPTLQSSDPSGKVIYINSFTKTLSPSFRISFMVLPERLIPLFEEKLGFYSCPVSAFEQYTLARFISEGHYEKHIIRMKNFYRNLRNNLIGALQNSALSKISSFHEKESGLHFLLKIDSKYSSEELEKRLKERGINLPLLKNFYYQKIPENDDKTFVVNYSGIKKENIEKAVLKIEDALC